MNAFELAKTHQESNQLKGELEGLKKEHEKFDRQYAQKEDLYNRKKHQLSLQQKDQNTNVTHLLKAQKKHELDGVYVTINKYLDRQNKLTKNFKINLIQNRGFVEL